MRGGNPRKQVFHEKESSWKRNPFSGMLEEAKLELLSDGLANSTLGGFDATSLSPTWKLISRLMVDVAGVFLGVTLGSSFMYIDIYMERIWNFQRQNKACILGACSGGIAMACVSDRYAEKIGL